MSHRINEIVYDCADPQALAQFYCDLVDGRPRQSRPDWATIWADPLILGFQKVPEGKTVKNRCHIDFEADDLEAAAARAESLGAQRIGGIVDDPPGAFIVLQDPEGNEFCFVAGYPQEPDV